MIKNISICLVLLSSFLVKSQDIPANRITNWSTAGACTLIKDTVVNIMHFGGDSLGITDNTLAFNTAKAAILNGGGYIYFPAGEYKFTSSLTLSDGIVVKGSGANLTSIKFDLSGSGDFFKVLGSIQPTKDTLLSGYIKGSTIIKVQNANLYNTGNYIKLVEDDNGRIFSSWANNTIGQIVKVIGVNIATNELTIDQELRQTYTSTLNPRINILNAITNVGFECFRLERLDQTSGQTNNINFTYAANCYVKGVESHFSNFSHVKIQNSTNVMVSESFFKDGFDYGGGGKAYGVAMQITTGNCLIQNNQFEHLRHSVLLQAGSNGNVIGYNYSKDPYWVTSWLPANSAGDMVLHGNYVYMNLFEGNICQNIVIDNSHGINGPYNTFFRNRGENYGIFMNSSPASDSQNFVGNELTNTTIAMYSLAGTGHFEYGNNHKGTIKPSGTVNLTKSSYYLTDKPWFWKGVGNWESIGMPNPYNQTTIPAKKSYEDANLTWCYGDTLYYNELVCYGDTFFLENKQFYGIGNYFDSVSTQTGCIKYVDVTLSYTQKSTITQTWFLESSLGITYQWYLNGQVLVDDTSKIYGFTQNGYYQVEVLDTNGCITLSDSIFVNSTNVAHLTKDKFKVYPNPTKNNLVIEVEKSGAIYQLFSTNGRLVLEGELKHTKTTLNLAKLDKGIYYLSIENTNKKIVLN